jgi:ABC-2 type transport system ATP-binding protein
VIGRKDGDDIVRIKDGRRPNDVLQYLLGAGVEIHSFNEILPSLNDIFIKLVEGTPTARQFQEVKA